MTDTNMLELLLEKVTQIQQEATQFQQETTNRFEKLENKFDILSLKHDLTHRKLNDLSLDVKIAERDIRQDINILKDSTDTIVVVLEDKGILPKAQ